MAIRGYCTTEETAESLDLADATGTVKRQTQNEPVHDLDYFHRTMSALLARGEWDRVLRVLEGMPETNPVRFVTNSPFPDEPRNFLTFIC
jgi:hypothetical protein